MHVHAGRFYPSSCGKKLIGIYRVWWTYLNGCLSCKPLLLLPSSLPIHLFLLSNLRLLCLPLQYQLPFHPLLIQDPPDLTLTIFPPLAVLSIPSLNFCCWFIDRLYVILRCRVPEWILLDWLCARGRGFHRLPWRDLSSTLGCQSISIAIIFATSPCWAWGMESFRWGCYKMNIFW